MRASGVFTGTTNSPSRSPRQSIYHSTIRAGRNLPDKEFRSVSPTLFPEKPDFLFRVLCSYRSFRPYFFHSLRFQVVFLVYPVKDLSEPCEGDPLPWFQGNPFKGGN